MKQVDPDDEDALRWAGDEVAGREGARSQASPIQDAVAGAPADVAMARTGPRSGGATRALTVLFGAAYLALTVGWILAVQYTGSGSRDLPTELLWQFGEFTAIVAAPLWFATTLVLTRGGRLAQRLGWFALGAGLLLPWPLVPLFAAAGS